MALSEAALETKIVERLTPAEAAARLGFSRDLVYRLIKAGDLRAFCISPSGAQVKQWRIRSDDLADFEARRTAGGAGQ